MRLAIAAVLLALAPAPAAFGQAQAPGPTPVPTTTAVPMPTPTITATPVPTVTPVPTEPVITSGVTAGGVDLSGMTRDEAIAALQDIKTRLGKDLFVRVRDVTRTLPMSRIHYYVNLAATVEKALEATGPRDIALVNHWRTKPLRVFVTQFAGAVAVAPRDASIHITVLRIVKNAGKPGRALRTGRTRRLIGRALNDPSAGRRIAAPRRTVHPAVRTSELKNIYPSIITVDQSEFTARLFKNLHYFKSYSIAVGQPAYPTPNGLFSIQSKQVDPVWTAPNSPWAGELAGQSFSASDPTNPLKARWMGVTNGVGFHGTGEDYSIGTAASHGCMRMHVSDVIDLFDRVSIGTPVLIAP